MRLSRFAPLAFCLAAPLLGGVSSAAPLPGGAREESAPPVGAGDGFLDEVDLLISEEERAAYLALARPYQRKEFERRFWQVRDPYPQTPRNELAERWRARYEIAASRYANRSDDRFRILLWNGEPAEVVRLRCPQLLRVGEAWIYARTEAIPTGFTLVFLTGGVSENAPHRLWNARGGLRDAFSASAGTSSGGAGDTLTSERVVSECPRGEEILRLLAGAADWPELANHFPVAPRVHPEWLTTFTARSTDAPAGAETLAAEVEIRFSGRNQSRTIVDAAVLVDAAELARPQAAGGLVLDGDILRGEELFEHFRYRYDLPSDRAAGRKVPFAARRFLRPGSYTVVLRLQESTGSRFYRVELPLEVPAPAELPGEPPTPVAAADPDAAASVAAGTAPTATAGGESAEPKLRLLAPIDRLVSGRLRVEAIVEGFEPKRVDFALDGKPLFAKRRPPFSIDVDLGRVPRLRRLAAVAYDAAGAAVADDELVLNGGPHRFAVRIVEPERAPAAGERIEARARVDLPEGEKLDRLEFWLDEERLATLYGPPWAVALEAPRDRRVSYLRAVAYLDGGPDPISAEDIRLLSGAEDSLAVEVDFVELYTSVLDRRGRPVAGLAQDEVRILEDGAEQEIRRFEPVDDAPIHAGVMIDTSASMREELADTRVAAERFVREILTPRDRAAVITFADSPRLAARFTNDIEVLAGGLASIGAEGETHLHDALAYALHYFSGVRGKRAIVVLSDFVDSGSRYRVDEILEYARRTGVAIYGIGLNVPRDSPEAGMLLDRLTRETGGRSFRVSRAKELGPVYEAIRAELRAQYLFAYQSSRVDGSLAYREIEVEVRRPGAEARTLAGYYP